MNPILYIVINKDLKMSAGKAAAQAVHAAMMNGEKAKYFIESYKRTVVVLEATTEQIRNLEEYLSNTGLWADYYIDEGSNEVAPYSITALAVEPMFEHDGRRDIFADLSLYRGDYGEPWEVRDEETVKEEERTKEQEALYHLKQLQDKYVHRVYTDKFRGMYYVVDSSPRWLKKAIKKLGEM